MIFTRDARARRIWPARHAGQIRRARASRVKMMQQSENSPCLNSNKRSDAIGKIGKIN